jgi:hypothetical protein
MSGKLPDWWYRAMKWPEDRRQRKRVHRQLARQCLKCGTFLNPNPLRGTTLHEVAQWHLQQARKL